MRPILVWCIAGAAAATLSGCATALVECCQQPVADYVLVEYRGASAVGATSPAEVQETSSYTDTRGKVHTIALKFPDECRTESAALATGASTTTQGIMGTQCGVWLAELERALSEQHYKVISWSALRQEQDTKHISTYDAARSLGAEVVFVVNSMEASPVTRGQVAGALTRYFKSNAKGEPLEKLAPAEKDRPFLKSFASSRANLNNDDVIGLSATLDVTAVLASTGESIWFYRHSVSEARAVAAGMRFLFARATPEGELQSMRPEGLPVVVNEPNRATEDVDHVATNQAPQDMFQAEKHRLARGVASECVDRFGKGTK